MDEQELRDFREELVMAITARRRLGDYNADASHMLLMLEGLLKLTDHALIQIIKQPKGKK